MTRWAHRVAEEKIGRERGTVADVLQHLGSVHVREEEVWKNEYARCGSGGQTEKQRTRPLGDDKAPTSLADDEVSRDVEGPLLAGGRRTEVGRQQERRGVEPNDPDLQELARCDGVDADSGHSDVGDVPDDVDEEPDDYTLLGVDMKNAIGGRVGV